MQSSSWFPQVAFFRRPIDTKPINFHRGIQLAESKILQDGCQQQFQHVALIRVDVERHFFQ